MGEFDGKVSAAAPEIGNQKPVAAGGLLFRKATRNDPCAMMRRRIGEPIPLVTTGDPVLGVGFEVFFYGFFLHQIINVAEPFYRGASFQRSSYVFPAAFRRTMEPEEAAASSLRKFSRRPSTERVRGQFSSDKSFAMD